MVSIFREKSSRDPSVWQQVDQGSRRKGAASRRWRRRCRLPASISSAVGWGVLARAAALDGTGALRWRCPNSGDSTFGDGGLTRSGCRMIAKCVCQTSLQNSAGAIQRSSVERHGPQ